MTPSSGIKVRRWTRIEYDRLVEGGFLRADDAVELLDGGLYARAGIADYWIVNLAERRLEVYREPAPDAAAPFGWRYRSVIVPDREAVVSPLAAPVARVRVADLLI